MLSTLKINERNPRTITEDRFAALVKSIKDFPQMMELRPIITDKDGVVIGGTMRLRACLKLGMTSVPASWVRRADKLTPAERKRFIVMDNAGFGEWDTDILSADYDLPELEDMGLDLEELGKELAEEEGDEQGDAEPSLCTCDKCGNKHEAK